MSKQYGFLVNIGRCVQCEACVAACKTTHNLELGMKWRRVITYWHGEFPAVVNRTFTLSCQHCARPACVDVCPSSALSKRAKDGVVVLDRDACTNCKICGDACPYGAIQFAKDDSLQKCDFCSSRLARGQAPSCVVTCPTNALQFGTTEELAKISGAQQVEGELGPALFIIPPTRAWDLRAFRSALARAKEPSVPQALTVIL